MFFVDSDLHDITYSSVRSTFWFLRFRTIMAIWVVGFIWIFVLECTVFYLDGLEIPEGQITER